MNENIEKLNKASLKVKNAIEALCDLRLPAWELGMWDNTVKQCRKNNRIVFEFNEYLLINIDGVIYYCLKSEINFNKEK